MYQIYKKDYLKNKRKNLLDILLNLKLQNITYKYNNQISRGKFKYFFKILFGK